MREIKEIHFYPREGFNDIKFGDNDSYIRNMIGDPYCTLSSPKDDYFVSIYNGGNLELYFKKSTRSLIKIKYDINLPSKTRFYMGLEAVSPYLPNIEEWLNSSKYKSFEDLHISFESIRDLRRVRSKSYICLYP